MRTLFYPSLQYEIVGRKNEQGEQGGEHQTAHHDGRKVALYVGADARGQCRGQHAHGRYGSRHQDGPETLDCAGEDGIAQTPPLSAHPVDVGDHDDAVLHRHPEQCDEADGGRHIERLAPQVKRDQAAQGGERDHREEQDRLAHLPELREQEDRHEGEHDAHGESQPRLGALLAFELAPHSEAVLGGIEMDGSGRSCLSLGLR